MTPPIEPVYSQVVDADLASVEPSMGGTEASAGPRIRSPRLRELPSDAEAAPNTYPCARTVDVPGRTYSVQDGPVLIASITSCTNTSNRR